MNTWGISGPAFLVIFGLLLAAGWAAGFVRQRRIGRWVHTSGLPLDDLSAYEIAMLNGGAPLVVGAAAAHLREQKHIRVEGDKLALSVPPPPGADEVERWVYARYQQSPSTSAPALAAALARDPVLIRICQRLRGLGLMPTDEDVRSLRLQVLWFVPILALGVVRLVAGLHAHRATGLLAIFLIGGLILAVHGARRRPLTTTAGARLLTTLKKQELGTTETRGGLAASVALTGFGALWVADAGLAAALALPRESSGWWGGGGGGGGGCGGGCGG